MPQAASLNGVSAPPFGSLPFHAEHRSSRTGAALILLLLVPVLAMVIVPVGLVLAFAGHEVRDAMAHHPVAAAILSAGLIAWMALFLVPAKRIIHRFGHRRHVTIAHERVTVADDSLFGARHWSAPLAEFRGIAHHVRSTLSGVRHELILVHPSRAAPWWCIPPMRSGSRRSIARPRCFTCSKYLRMSFIASRSGQRTSPTLEALPAAQAA